MKTGWKKTIAPLVLVSARSLLRPAAARTTRPTAVAAAGTVRRGSVRRHADHRHRPAAAGRLGRRIGRHEPGHQAAARSKIGNKAGTYSVGLKEYDDSTAAKGAWDDATCTANANAHVTNKAEVAVMGTYNSGCAKLEVPILNQDPSGPMLMISHANTNPGLTKAWDPGEPQKYYPTGKL